MLKINITILYHFTIKHGEDTTERSSMVNIIYLIQTHV